MPSDKVSDELSSVWNGEQLTTSIDIRYAESDNIAVRMLAARDKARDARLLAYLTAKLSAVAVRLERDIDQAEDARSLHIAAAAALGSLKALAASHQPEPLRPADGHEGQDEQPEDDGGLDPALFGKRG